MAPDKYSPGQSLKMSAQSVARVGDDAEKVSAHTCVPATAYKRPWAGCNLGKFVSKPGTVVM